MNYEKIINYKIIEKASLRTNNFLKVISVLIILYFLFGGGGVSGLYKNMPNDDFSYNLKSNGTYDIIYENRVTTTGKWEKVGDKIIIGKQTFDYKGNRFCEFSIYKGDEVCYYKQ